MRTMAATPWAGSGPHRVAMQKRDFCVTGRFDGICRENHSILLAIVHRANLCSGCGLCAAVLGPSQATMTMTEPGFLRPVLTNGGADAI